MDTHEESNSISANIRLLARKLQGFDTLSVEELRVLSWMVSGSATFEPDRDLVRAGDSPKVSTLIVTGWAARYKTLATGSRQITAVHMPGDFVDLHGFLLHPMDHGVVALSACRVATSPHERLRVVTEKYPHLTRLLWLNTLLDAAMHREWLVAMGRLRTFTQLAHLICELYYRLDAIDLIQENSFEFPVTQTSIADMLGVSQVHVNRAIQDLRARGFLSWQSKVVKILDLNGLRAFAQFDPAYLYQNREPR